MVGKMLQNGTILLLNLHPGSELVSTLKAILASCPQPAFRVFEETLPADGSLDYSSALDFELKPDAILVAVKSHLPNQPAALLGVIEKKFPGKLLLFVLESGAAADVFELLRLGAEDFIVAPINANNVLPRVWRLLTYVVPEQIPVQELKRKLGLQQIVGENPGFVAEIRKIPLLAKCDATVLISGETGTGKELFARAIHYLSARTGKPFIPVNCGAIPLELAEAELFGHQRGAFTGAVTSKRGLIEEANGGTILLDEIDCLPLSTQVKVLRFLQEKEYRSLGSTTARKADVRIIAATNRDLEEEVGSGRLRQDLYYRLNVVPLVLPPLRERMEDIQLLAHHFLSKYAGEFNRRAANFSADALRKLLLHDWPGNVRELENVIQRSALLCESSVLEDSELLLSPREEAGVQEPFRKAKAKMVSHFEKHYVEALLLAYAGNISKAARAAQKNRRAFWELIRKHGIEVGRFKAAGA